MIFQYRVMNKSVAKAIYPIVGENRDVRASRCIL